MLIRGRYYRFLSPDAGDEGTGAGASGNAAADDGGDLGRTLATLSKERGQREAAEKASRAAADALAAATTREAELQKQLEQFKGVDPAKFQELVDKQSRADQEALKKSQQWDVLEKNLTTQVNAEKTAAAALREENANLFVSLQLGQAFRSAGGIEDVQPVDGAEVVQPIDLIKSYLGSRLKREGDQLVLLDTLGKPEKNADGKPKSLGEKMIELKKGSLGNLFRAESTASGGGAPPSMVMSDGRQKIVYTRAQTMNGTADMAKIASGEAVVID
jgi:hypothetical protein